VFAHEKLHVYSKALDFVADASNLLARWDRKHALVDQLDRALDSVILNLAEGARFQSGPGKLRAADYAVGSALECAAGLDLAQIKSLLTASETIERKQALSEVTRMLVGLRKSWEDWSLDEEPPAYTAEQATPVREPLFHHERLEVYQVALGVMRWWVTLPAGNDLSSRLFRRIDEASTSMALNIAEGNGRYADLDHRRFLDMAASAAVKVAAYLDLAVQKSMLDPAGCSPAKDLLGRVLAMLSRM
jgi:four helix bundle protein